jgi:hypothetical protein
MASNDIKEEKKTAKKLKKEKAKVEKVKKEKTKKEKKKVKKTKKLDTVVFVDNEEQAKAVLDEVMKGPIVEEEKTSNFWSELKAFFLIILFIGGVVGIGFLVFKYVKPFESKKQNVKEETKVTETSEYKTVSYKPSQGNSLRVINDQYLIEFNDRTLYKLLDMDGNVLFEGTEPYTDILVGVDDELYLTHAGANLENDNASLSIYKFDNKELVEVFTAADEDYLFTTLIYTNKEMDYLIGVVGEKLVNEDEAKVESLLYTLDGNKQEIKDVRLHGENPFRAAVDEPIITFSKDYIIVKDTNNEYKYGIYDIKNSEIVLNTKYDGLYTTSVGDYVAVKGKKTGIVNVKSKILVDFKYDFIYDAGGFYVVSKDKKLGILDNEFNVVIKPTFTFQQVENAGFSYQLCCGATNSFDAYKYKDKYILTVNANELSYQLKYKVHETYVIDSKGEYLTIGANEFDIYKDFIYSYDKDAKKYSIYDSNFAEKYTIDISEYDFEDGPYISLVNDNTIIVSLDTELYYDYSTGEEIETIKDATFTIDKIEFKYNNKDKEVSLKVNGEVIGTYGFDPINNYDVFYYNVGDKMYYYVTENIYVMVRKSE